MEDAQGNEFMAPQNSTTNSSSTIKDKEDDARISCEGSNGDVVQTSNNGGMYTTQTVNTNCTLN